MAAGKGGCAGKGQRRGAPFEEEWADKNIRKAVGILPDFQRLLHTEEYGFIKNNPRLGKRILLLGIGGSYAYGTAQEGSDIDLRAVAKSR